MSISVDSKLLARIGAIVFVAIAITMTAIQMRDASKASPSPESTHVAVIEPDADPLRDELIRCQAIGAAGASDTACLRAWAENRRRFLAPGSRPQAAIAEPIQAIPGAASDAVVEESAPAQDAGR